MEKGISKRGEKEKGRNEVKIRKEEGGREHFGRFRVFVRVEGGDIKGIIFICILLIFNYLHSY